MHCRGRLDRDESDQWHPCGVAAEHHDLHAGLRRERRHFANGKCDGGCECRRGADQRRVRVREWHASIVCTCDEPLHGRYVIAGGRLGPVDMELRRF
jgi:hypothetical protein